MSILRRSEAEILKIILFMLLKQLISWEISLLLDQNYTRPKKMVLCLERNSLVADSCEFLPGAQIFLHSSVSFGPQISFPLDYCNNVCFFIDITAGFMNNS